MTEGDRIALEYIGPGPEAAEARATLARRIDAALAEQQEAFDVRLAAAAELLRLIRVAAGITEPTDAAALPHIVEGLSAALGEREAQIAALEHEASRVINHVDPDRVRPWCINLWAVLANTADAARVFVERIQAEEREHVAAFIEEEPLRVWSNAAIAAAIRALPRRGT